MLNKIRKSALSVFLIAALLCSTAPAVSFAQEVPDAAPEVSEAKEVSETKVEVEAVEPDVKLDVEPEEKVEVTPSEIEIVPSNTDETGLDESTDQTNSSGGSGSDEDSNPGFAAVGADTTPPFMTHAIWLDMDHSDSFNGGDKFSFFFNEPIIPSTINQDNVNTRLGLNNHHSFGSIGNGMNVNWDLSDVLTVTLGSDATVFNGDRVNPSDEVVDLAGNPDGTLVDVVLTTGEPIVHFIGASAGSNGTISPSGTVIVDTAEDQTFTITPNVGFQVSNVFVDGASVGAVGTYTFADVNSNHSIEAQFGPADPAAPTITILGDNPMEMVVGTSFNDPGATAVDQFGNDISHLVENSGIVFVDVIGTYTKTYTVTDPNNGLTDTETRTVNVVEAPVIDQNQDDDNGNDGPKRQSKPGRKRVMTQGTPMVLGASTSIYNPQIAQLVNANRALFIALQNQGYVLPSVITIYL